MTPRFLEITNTKIARQGVVSLMKRWDLPTVIISLGIQPFAPILSSVVNGLDVDGCGWIWVDILFIHLFEVE